MTGGEAVGDGAGVPVGVPVGVSVDTGVSVETIGSIGAFPAGVELGRMNVVVGPAMLGVDRGASPQAMLINRIMAQNPLTHGRVRFWFGVFISPFRLDSSYSVLIIYHPQRSVTQNRPGRPVQAPTCTDLSCNIRETQVSGKRWLPSPRLAGCLPDNP